ncbi:unannotated protein [freshwater metagenome]|uniref:Unannotated protein n=1 Tax=freshwater metagenome TaxID=449393 RepID=A0A6J7HHR1_9ZZZZ
MRDLLEFHGLDYGHGPLSEPMVFGLAGGLGFFFSDQVPGIPFYLVGRTGSMERDIGEHLAAPVTFEQTDDAAQGWESVKAAIDRGDPPMVWADIGELEYLRVRMRNTRHDIVIVDHDEGRGIAWVADNDREDLQACSLDSLHRARNSQSFPAPTRNAMFTYRWPTELPALADVVRDVASATSKNMRQSAQTVGSLEGRTGLDGVEYFAGTFGDWPARFGDRLPEALDTLAVLIIKAGTGGAMFRSLQAGYLEETAELLDDATVRSAAERYRTLSDAWEALGARAAAHEVAEARDVIQQIRRLEPEALQALERTI